jgi:mono/diheme cytochrome c family protein
MALLRRGALPPMLCALATLAGVSTSARASPAQDYTLHCQGCHGASAEGVRGKVPPLAHTLLQFMRSPAGRSYVLRVPGASNSMLTDAQLADVLNWIAVHFGLDPLPAAAPAFTAQEVATQRHVAMASVQATRREVVRQLASTGAGPTEDY